MESLCCSKNLLSLFGGRDFATQKSNTEALGGDKRLYNSGFVPFLKIEPFLKAFFVK